MPKNRFDHFRRCAVALTLLSCLGLVPAWAFLRITQNDGQAVVTPPGLPSGAGVEQEAALLLGILFSAIRPLGQRIFAYNVALLTSKAFQLL